MTLYELTGNESGIIVYDEEKKSVAAVNWLTAEEDTLPMLSPFGYDMIDFPQDEGWADILSEERVDDFRSVLPGSIWITEEKDEAGNPVADTDLDIVYDPHNDFANAFLAPEETYGKYLGATVYKLACGVTIIVPEMWV